MRTAMLALAASAALASPACAQVNEDFDGEGNDNSVLNWPGNANVSVPDGTVDLVRSGEFGITCAGGSGSCIDLDGSTNAGGSLRSSTYSFQAGDLINFVFLASSNQRNPNSDNLQYGFSFGSSTSLIGLFQTTPTASGNLGSFSTSGFGTASFVPGNAGFGSYGLRFRAGNAGSLSYFISDLNGTNTGDNQGPIIDNISLSIGAVPEPGTWAMMILGFGLIGGALRTRKRAVLAVA
jgi:PEP-CTERM motif